jgi:hypothetical protein
LKVILSSPLPPPPSSPWPGFKALICKDFNSFGHMFRQRSGAHDPYEYSPIFIQFLDTVWQLWRQHPWEFEFTDKLLLTLVYGVVSRYTDDFIYDHERQQSEHEKVWRMIIREERCPHCVQRAKERFCSFATALSTGTSRGEQSQSQDESETVGSSSAMTWKTVGGAGGGGAGDSPSVWKSIEEPEQEEEGCGEDSCAMCEQLLTSQCSTSIWRYVAHNLEDFLNPLYQPTRPSFSSESFPTAAPNDSFPATADSLTSHTSSFSDPISFGGSYLATHTDSLHPTNNTASDHDLGIHRAPQLPSYRSQIPKSSSDYEGLQRLYGDVAHSVPPLGLDGDIMLEGISLPKQLFITAAAVGQQAHLKPSRTPSSSSSLLASSGTRRLSDPPPLSTSSPLPNGAAPTGAPESTAEGNEPPPLSPPLTDEVFFLMPCFEVQHLAVWESAYFSGIPSLKSFSAPSAAFTRGMVSSWSEICTDRADLLKRNEQLERKVKELSLQLAHQQHENYLIETELSTYSQRMGSHSQPARRRSGPGPIHQARQQQQAQSQVATTTTSDEDEGYVLFEDEMSAGTADAEDTESRIISTALLIEDYITGPAGSGD